MESYFSDKEEEEDRSVNFVNNSNRKSNPRPPRSGGQKDATKTDFPHGKTMNRVSFERDDTKISSNQIHVDWEPSKEEEVDKLYLAMLAETKTTISAYESENMLKQFALDIHSSQGNIRRTLAATKREIPAVKTREEITQTRDLPEANLNKVYPTHRNERKNKGKQREVEVAVVIEKTPNKITERIYEPGKVFPTTKGRSLPEGMGSLGSKALHMRARIHKLDADDVKARLDSGADVTLISEESWKTMIDPPRLQEGMRMKLYPLVAANCIDVIVAAAIKKSA